MLIELGSNQQPIELQSGMLTTQPHDADQTNRNKILNWNKNLQVRLLLLHIISSNYQNTLIYLMQVTKFLSGKILENIDAGRRIWCPGSLMSLYGPTFHVTPVDLCIIFQCNLYIFCIMPCGKKLFQIVSKYSKCMAVHRSTI